MGTPIVHQRVCRSRFLFTARRDAALSVPRRPLSPQERRPERNGSLRVLYAARIGHCRASPLREQCPRIGNDHQSATGQRHLLACFFLFLGFRWVLSCIRGSFPFTALSSCALGRLAAVRITRREVMKLLRHQRVDVELAETAPPTQSSPVRLLSRAERAHYRLSWEQRLARNARRSTAPLVSIRLFGIPEAFAMALGLRVA